MCAIVKDNVVTNFKFLITGNILEIGALHSIAIGTKDPQLSFDRFERYMAQLKCYYLDYK